MRIANSPRANVESLVAHAEVLANHFTPRASDGNRIAPETHLAHVHANRVSILEGRGAHDTTERVHRKFLVLSDELLIEQVPAENAQYVTALFRFAAVGIENAQTKWRALRGQRAIKNSV